MNKINFEDLPSTNTPVNAENLNAMQTNAEKVGNYIGSTQPSTGEKVWIKAGKNLLDKNNLLPLFMPPNSTDEVLAYNATTFTTPWIKCSANMSYVISGGNRNRWQLKSNTGVITFIDRATITTNPDTEYFRCYCYADGSLDNANIQIEQGSTATTYEPYVEKEVLVKNDSGVFENFINEEDADIYRTELVNVNNNFSTIDVNSVQKYGRLVQVNFRGLLQKNVSSNSNILSGLYGNPTIGSGFTNVLYTGGQYQVTTPEWFYIGQGSIKGPALTSGKWIHISFTYICE